MTILPLAYIPGIEWFTRLASDDCIIDTGENWIGQTVRNRAEILSVNGVQTLSVPVHGSTGGHGFAGKDRGDKAGFSDGRGAEILMHNGRIDNRKIATKDVKIDNSKKWQHQHWISLISAYRNSPFFDHYEELFAPVFTQKFHFLIDLNLELLNVLTSVLRIGDRVKISDNYVVALPGDIDLRGKKAFRRKAPDGNENRPEYVQVFSDRMPFEPGLSIVDAIFCEGANRTGELIAGR